MKATICFLSLLALPLLSTNCRRSSTTTSASLATVGDVSFARHTFESLAKGESSVADKIDWPVYTSLGENLGASYTALAYGVEKEKFVSGYVSQFAINFLQSGGNLECFTNWRVVSHDSMKTEVAADTPNGVLTVVVAERDGVERVSSINIVK
jgi:hypothetical protein